MKPPTADLSIESTLRRCELLEPLSDAQLAELAARARLCTLQRGETLFRANDDARDLLVVEGGRLGVRLASPGGRVIGEFEVGQYSLSGWSALVAPHTYVADAWALEDAAVLMIGAADAEEVMLREPEAAYAVMKRIAAAISTRLRDVKEEFIESLGAVAGADE